MATAAKLPDVAPGFGEDSGPRQKTRVHHAVRWNGREIALREGQTAIGRHPACQIVLDSPLVSRRHARLVVSAAGVMVEDLGSRNGVRVNGTTITGGVTVLAGDRILIGDQELELLRRLEKSPAELEAERRAAKTMMGLDAACNDDEDDESNDNESTRSANAFDLLSGVIDKAIAMGRAEEAERLLSGHLQHILQDVEAGRVPESALTERGVHYAVKLAELSRKPGWINYSIRVYAGLGRPLPMEVVNELYALLRKVRGVDVALLRQYVALLHSRVPEYSPTDRFAVKRIEGLSTLTGV
jgi:hypothetical protein